MTPPFDKTQPFSSWTKTTVFDQHIMSRGFCLDWLAAVRAKGAFAECEANSSQVRHRRSKADSLRATGISSAKMYWML
jgi:hypothetical protein